MWLKCMDMMYLVSQHSLTLKLSTGRKLMWSDLRVWVHYLVLSVLSWCLLIHPLYIPACPVQGYTGLETVPAHTGWGEGYTLDTSPVYHRADTWRQTSPPAGNWVSSSPDLHVFGLWGGGGGTQCRHLEKIPTPHNCLLDSNWRFAWCEATALSTEPPCRPTFHPFWSKDAWKIIRLSTGQ